MISVLILTFNEASDLPDCLQSLSWCGDVHVFDSHSTDQTVAIAQRWGAHVHQRRFTHYAEQRNAALEGIGFKYDWVLLLDADERVPAPLAREMGEYVASSAAAGVVAVRLRRRDYLFGTWLKHAQISPFYLRLVRPKLVHYEREINEVLIPGGPVAQLKEHFDHFPFSKGLSHWISKHNQYSTMEAQRAELEARTRQDFSLRLAIFAGDFNVRRYHQKGIYYKLPGRPLMKLGYMLIARRAFLDGYAGLTYSLLQAIYEYLITIKQRELRQLGNFGP